jgi:TPR repeat protein
MSRFALAHAGLALLMAAAQPAIGADAQPAAPAAEKPANAGTVVVKSGSRRYAEAVRNMPTAAGSPCFFDRDPLYGVTRSGAPEGERVVTEMGPSERADPGNRDAPTSRACQEAERALAARARIALKDRTWDEGLQAYGRKDYGAALELFKRGYRQIGHANHGYMVGVMLFNGQGAPRDPAAGIDWLKKVADASPYLTDAVRFQPGAPDNGTSKIDALHALAVIYGQGKDVPVDAAKARDYFARAAALGHVVSQVSLARMMELGQGGKQDGARAHQLYLDAAQLGYAPAQYMVGRQYAAGEGVAADPAKAFDWFSRAADNKDDRSRRALAQYELARLYDEGVGAPKDPARALELYRLAAEAGHVHALAAVAHFYYFGEVVPKNHGTALQVYRLAAERGSPEAMNALGAMLFRGEGGGADPVQAYRWLRKAERAGVDTAAAALKAVQASLTPAQLAQIDAAP